MKKTLFILLTLLCFGSFAQTPTATHCTVNGKGSNETGTNSVITAVVDHEGNSYTVVQYGPYCWMRQNMRCTSSPSTGSNILVDNANENSFSYTGKKAYYYKNNSENSADYFGLLYNWCAAADTFNASLGETSTNVEENNALDFRFTSPRRGICPAGWHLPSKEEWTTLIGLNCASNGQYADILAGGEDWLESLEANTPGNYDEADRASSNFDALPAGLFCPAGFCNRSKEALFWTSTSLATFGNFAKAHYCRLNYDENAKMSDVMMDECAGRDYFYSDKRMAYSVRCVRDALCTGTTAVTVTFDANGGSGTMTAQNGIVGQSFALTSNGFTRPNYLFIGWNTQANGKGSYYANAAMVALQYNVTLYAQWKALTDKPCMVPTLATNELGEGNIMHAVVDHEGNAYSVVQIGNQCWLKENMRCLTSPSTGTSILEALANGSSYSGKKAYYYGNNSTNAENGYGLLYNWNAAVDTFNTVLGETSCSQSPNDAVNFTSIVRRGICPQGWHIPSDAEWTQLTDYVSNQSEYQCNYTASYIAKALASTTGWSNSTNTCAVGNNPGTNNASDFSAVPAGCYSKQGNKSSFTAHSNSALFWSATATQGYNNSYAHYRTLSYINPVVDNSQSQYCYKFNGLSVRCLRD